MIYRKTKLIDISKDKCHDQSWLEALANKMQLRSVSVYTHICMNMHMSADICTHTVSYIWLVTTQHIVWW
jgi:hypothetical protein